MAQNHSMDIVSEIDLQEADNAVNQAIKEIHQRYDLKDSNTTIELNKKDKNIIIGIWAIKTALFGEEDLEAYSGR